MDNRRGLGRGLRSLIPGSDREVPEGPARELALDKIEKNPYQPRKYFDSSKLNELAESVRQHGVLQPLVVREREGGFELIAGERRLEAAKRAGLESVPVIVRVCEDAESLELALVENVQREDIGALEAAAAYHRLMGEFGLSQEAVAQRVGKSRSAVANTLRLLNLPVEIQQSLSGGEITEGHARALLGLSDPAEQQQVWRDTIKSQASVRETERMVREVLNPEAQGNPQGSARGARGATSSRAQDPNLLQVENDLRRRLGTKVGIRRRGDRGAITIEFYSDEDLERILGLMTQ